MPKVNLNNITIKEKEDKNFNKYYLIINNDNQDEVYFCFEKAVKEGWGDLVNNYENLKEIEIEFETNERGNNKVISIYSPQGEEILI